MDPTYWMQRMFVATCCNDSLSHPAGRLLYAVRCGRPLLPINVGLIRGGIMEPMRLWAVLGLAFLTGCGQAAVSYGPALAPDQLNAAVNAPLIQ
jgi:hypothetical protein